MAIIWTTVKYDSNSVNLLPNQRNLADALTVVGVPNGAKMKLGFDEAGVVNAVTLKHNGFNYKIVRQSIELPSSYPGGGGGGGARWSGPFYDAGSGVSHP